MVKIRLRRTGAKKKPHYRVVVADSRTPRDGRFIEIVGHYNPRTDPHTLQLQEDRVLYWLSVGAQPTDRVKKLLDNLGTLDRFGRLKEGADLDELLAEARAAHEAAQSKVATQAKPENESVTEEEGTEKVAAQVEPEEESVTEEEGTDTETSAPLEDEAQAEEEASSEEEDQSDE